MNTQQVFSTAILGLILATLGVLGYYAITNDGETVLDMGLDSWAEMSEMSEAGRDLERLSRRIEENPEDGEAYAERARVFHDMEDYGLAIEDCAMPRTSSEALRGIVPGVPGRG